MLLSQASGRAGKPLTVAGPQAPPSSLAALRASLPTLSPATPPLLASPLSQGPGARAESYTPGEGERDIRLLTVWSPESRCRRAPASSGAAEGPSCGSSCW